MKHTPLIFIITLALAGCSFFAEVTPETQQAGESLDVFVKGDQIEATIDARVNATLEALQDDLDATVNARVNATLEALQGEIDLEAIINTRVGATLEAQATATAEAHKPKSLEEFAEQTATAEAQ